MAAPFEKELQRGEVRRKRVRGPLDVLDFDPAGKGDKGVEGFWGFSKDTGAYVIRLVDERGVDTLLDGGAD